MTSETWLISNPKTTHQAIVDLIQERVVGYITAKKYMMISYNASRKELAKLLEITPGKNSPTITGLDANDFCAVQALVLKKESAQKMDDLKKAGATDILLFAIANSRM